MSAFLTKIGVWLAEKLGAKFVQRLWKKIRGQPETKLKLPSGVEVTFKGEEAPGVYLNDGIGRFLAMPIRTPSDLPEVAEAKKLMESGESEKAEDKMRELLSEPEPAVEAPSEEQAFLAALRLLDEGDTKFHADDFAGAEKAYREAGEMAAKSGNELLQSLCLTVLGAAVGRQNRQEEALRLFDQALALNPGDATAWFNKGTALAALDRGEEAIPCFDEAIRLKPDFAGAWYGKGTMLSMLDRAQEAIPCFDEAIRLKPDFAKAWHGKGTMLGMLDRAQEAIPCLDEAIRLESDFAEAWCNKGMALTALDRGEEAIPCFDEAIRLKPDDAIAWYVKGTALFALGQDKNAKDSFEKAVGLREQLRDKGAAAFTGLTFLILIVGKEAKETALELIQLRKEADEDNIAQVVDEAIAKFKGVLTKEQLKGFRKFEKMLRELEKS